MWWDIRVWTVVQKGLVKDINTSENLYTLLLDGTTTKQLAKQTDFLIHHWSNNENEVVTRNLASKFFGHAKAEDICNKIDVMQENGLYLKLVFCISTDDPNISKLLWSKFNKQMRSLGYSGLILLVPYVFHIIQNRFHYEIVVYWNEVETYNLSQNI